MFALSAASKITSFRKIAVIAFAALVAATTLSSCTLAQTPPDGELSPKLSKEYHEVYDRLLTLTEGTSMHTCVERSDALEEGVIYPTGNPFDLDPVAKGDNPAADAKTVLTVCVNELQIAMYDDALPHQMPYGMQHAFGIPVMLPDVARPIIGPEVCKDRTDALQCIVDKAQTYEWEAPSVLSKNKTDRWNAWSKRWTKQPSPAVSEAMRQVESHLPGETTQGAQNRLDREVCLKTDAAQEGALRVAVNRRIAATHEAPGTAANGVLYGYFGRMDMYVFGSCKDFKE